MNILHSIKQTIISTLGIQLIKYMASSPGSNLTEANMTLNNTKTTAGTYFLFAEIIQVN